jgi:diguanylate cyclase
LRRGALCVTGQQSVSRFGSPARTFHAHRQDFRPSHGELLQAPPVVALCRFFRLQPLGAGLAPFLQPNSPTKRILYLSRDRPRKEIEERMEYFVWVAPWVIAAVCVGMAAGHFFGRSHKREPSQEELGQERRAVLQVLAELLGSAEKMTTDVKCHNTLIQEKAQYVGGIRVAGEMEGVKHALLEQMEGLLLLNMRLQNELLSNRYQMEERASALDEARREARIDALTEVANRKAFDEKLHVLMTAWEGSRTPFVLILSDLDHFKRINDSHGHPAGDVVLNKVGSWLREWVRKEDYVARYGGDEFAILLPGTELDAGLHLAWKLCEWTSERASEITVAADEVSVSLSIGVAAVREGDSVHSLLARADRGLYKSKKLGRNQVQHVEDAEQCERELCAAQ